jgi:hypothetical protein
MWTLVQPVNNPLCGTDRQQVILEHYSSAGEGDPRLPRLQCQIGHNHHLAMRLSHALVMTWSTSDAGDHSIHRTVNIIISRV